MSGQRRHIELAVLGGKMDQVRGALESSIRSPKSGVVNERINSDCWEKCGKVANSCHERTAFDFLLSARRVCLQTNVSFFFF